MKDILFKFFKFLMLFYMAFAWVLFIVITIILYIILSPFIIIAEITDYRRRYY